MIERFPTVIHQDSPSSSATRKGPPNRGSAEPPSNAAIQLKEVTEIIVPRCREQDLPWVDRSPRQWIGKRIWEAAKGWEREHLELILENTDSVARDHLGTHSLQADLANERTYLAWLRTSLSFASIGIAVPVLFNISLNIQSENLADDFKNLATFGGALGATFVGIALIVLALGVHRFVRKELPDSRFFLSQYWLTRGKFPAGRGAILIASAIAAMVCPSVLPKSKVTMTAFLAVIAISPGGKN
jgi:uncharacterized membrane protein YidH (DUF202 family)